MAAASAAARFGDYAKFTFNSIDAARRRRRRRRENIFGRSHNGDTCGGARYVRKIFSAPLRLFVGRTERENMDFQSISNFLVQRLGRERGQRREGKGRRRRIIQGGYFCSAARSPLFLCTSFFLSLGIASFLIPDNARARFPARLSHIKRQQCLNPFIIFPPRVLSISPSIQTPSTLALASASSSPPVLLRRV